MEPLENYKKEKITINLVWANIFGILSLIPIILIYGLPYYFVWKNDIVFNNFSLYNTLGRFWIIVLVLLAGIVVHELIHGITWSIFAKNGFKSIRFGVLWKMLTPYCHCKEPLKMKQYIIGAIMPAIVLGFIPAVAAIVVGNLTLLAFGIFFTMAACGDFLIIYALRKEKSNSLVEDHPSEAGCYVYRHVDEME